MKAWAPVAAGVLAGIAAGGIWTLVQPNRYGADARLLVRPPAAATITPAVEALAESSVVGANVAQTLHLKSPPHVSADVSRGNIVSVAVEAGGREGARQIDAEVVTVLTQKVGQRFGGNAVVVLDAAHADRQTSPTPTRNFLVSGVLGLAAGLLLTALLGRRRTTVAIGDANPGTERLLRARIDEVAKRERALARRAGELAKREAALTTREAREEPIDVRPPAPATPPAPAPQPVAAGRRTLADLERFVDAQKDASAERQEEWRTYLFLLREHADADGALPPTFDSLVDDVFARAR